ncbi:ArsA family ATPase [Streptomyces sp. XD-27]|uniref:ArsA family ATPase n=1 Tax=Streptomyces sp. XD-27 TaxID=3062779 RepID=UPI0026F430DC|nr:ArsA-related P-loop ATPase [Streptomyces sp. XD-27]WKX69865.1 ArsA-related P-loop ATPase [Streptomyces sp. XD-27]
MRTVLVTGLGGAGRTTVAAATALAAARQGRHVLLLTSDRGAAPDALLGAAGSEPIGADPAGSDPLGTEPAAAGIPWTAPTEAAPGLWAARIAAGEHVRAELTALQERGRGLLDMLGATPLEGEELTELPGTEAFALLRALHRVRGTRPPVPGTAGWDLVVVDMPPVPDTLAVLALPERLRRYLRRLLPAERQAARALRPMLAQLAGVPAPTEKLYELAERWERELAAVQAVVDARGTTLRLVAEPGPLAVRTLRGLRPGLALHGCRIEAVVANRLLPTGSTDPWLAALSGRQQGALKELAEEWSPYAPVHELPHLGAEPQGVEELAALAELLHAPAGSPDERPDAPAPDPWHVDDRLADDGELVWRLPLPAADRESLGLVRRGDELIVTAGPFHRVLPLPSALRRCAVSGAGLRDGELRVRFTPDPALWPHRP